MMTSLRLGGQTVTSALIAFGIGFAVVPSASADPAGPDQPQPVPGSEVAPSADALQGTVVAGAPVNPAGMGLPQGADPSASVQSSGDPTKDACDLFNKAVNYASINYEDFADYSAGSGNSVNYEDPTVDNANVAGRTALRQAAAAALNASGIPGAAPEVTTPMRSWSLSAAKLVLVMGVRGGGNTLNSTATDLNKQAHEAQLACATSKSQA